MYFSQTLFSISQWFELCCTQSKRSKWMFHSNCLSYARVFGFFFCSTVTILFIHEWILDNWIQANRVEHMCVKCEYGALSVSKFQYVDRFMYTVYVRHQFLRLNIIFVGRSAQNSKQYIRQIFYSFVFWIVKMDGWSVKKKKKKEEVRWRLNFTRLF